MGSTSETSTNTDAQRPTAAFGPFQSLTARLAVVALIGTAMIVVPLLVGRLTPGIAIFALAGTVMQIIRQTVTSRAPPGIAGESDTGRQQVLVKAVGLGGLVLPVIYMVTPWLDFIGYTMPLRAVVLGGTFYAVGLWIFWRSHVDLGRFWSPVLEVREDHRLVTNGIYRRIRHPMYASIFMCFVGQSLCLHNWIAGFSGLIAFTLLYLVRIGPEEQMLADTFGAEWQAYAARSGRLVPRS